MSERAIVAIIITALVGAILALAHAPSWAGVIAVGVLCFTALPWVMLREELLVDKFSLDINREVLLDGVPHVITNFTADGAMKDHTYIEVRFETVEQYLQRITATEKYMT